MLGIRYNFSLFFCSCEWQIQRMMIRLCEHDRYGNMFPLPQPNRLLADEFVLSVITFTDKSWRLKKKGYSFFVQFCIGRVHMDFIRLHILFDKYKEKNRSSGFLCCSMLYTTMWKSLCKCNLSFVLFSIPYPYCGAHKLYQMQF